ncbi:MAG: chloride channel protein [Candidatus Acidiferrales bacterium]
MAKRARQLLEYRLLRRYLPLVYEDLGATYSRNLHKWLVIAPIVGIATGLVVTAIAVIILRKMWPPVLRFYVAHHWSMIVGLTAGFAVTGLIMQYLTPDPNEHSTEEIIQSYHSHRGAIAMRAFVPKLIAAITTVGMGGSAALEGPSIYGGGAIGSWLWTKLGRLHLEPRDRRILLISGAAAGMAAVFRAPLTGLVFALEMPYKDDLAHEALLPSLIASVVSYVTLAAFLGASPLFNFASATSFTRRDLIWCAVLGLVIGLIALTFSITFRRVRTYVVKWGAPHWVKLTIGGFLTGVCGLVFVLIYKGSLVPIGPNYEAVGMILNMSHGPLELVVFGILKLLATLCSLGFGGVSAMFVPLFLTGGAFGSAFGQAVVHTSSLELYAAVGMAAFIAAGYKTPLAAVVFVAEATGGHAFIIPSLIGAAVAYAISGDASVSGDQRVNEAARVFELTGVPVSDFMQRHVVSVQVSSTLREFAAVISPEHPHMVFPVLDGYRVMGTIAASSLGRIQPEQWDEIKVSNLMQPKFAHVLPDCDAMEALRVLLREKSHPMLLVTSTNNELEGIVTKTDILEALKTRGAEEHVLEPADETA